MSFRRKELQELLLKELSPALAKHGFVPRPREQAFRAAKAFGWAEFHLAFIPHSNDFDVTADIGLRIDSIENIVNDYKTYLSKAEKKQTATMGCELGNLSEGGQRRWTVASEGDVRQVAVYIGKAFESIALPYVEKFSNLDTVFATLSSNERWARLHAPFHDERGKRAAGGARFAPEHSISTG